MTLLRPGNLVFSRLKYALPSELLASSFHTTCAPAASRERAHGAPSSSRTSARTRLVKDLRPKSHSNKTNPRSKLFEEAPRSKGRRDITPLTQNPTRASARHSFKDSRNERPASYGKKPESGRTAGNWRSSTKEPFPGKSRLMQSSRRLPTKEIRPTTRSKPKVDNPIVDEFDRSTDSETLNKLPSDFTSPPLMEGLLDSVHDVLGQRAKPTPIQALALKHLLSSKSGSKWVEYLLASETGSGKSLAYLLPMLQALKQSELHSNSSSETPTTGSPRMINPRAIVLAPTHELSRQLSGTAKSLLHNIKLRVVCASQANVSLKASRPRTAAKLSASGDEGLSTEIASSKVVSRPIDVLVGTPSKVLEMIRGHGWNWDRAQENTVDSWDIDSRGNRAKRQKFVVGEPEVGLERVEWVIIDEADVLFDPDFRDSTRLLLGDIAAARGQPVTNETSAEQESPASSEVDTYPFNLVLTSATIPSALATYLDTHHPNLTRLASPNLHRLPPNLKTEHASWTSGNRAADVEARIRRIWHGDTTHGTGVRSRVLVFCNKSTKVEEYGKYLALKGIPNVALTSTADARKRGNNHHLDGFLRTPLLRRLSAEQAPAGSDSANAAKPGEAPHVLITTSLLSRGLDFSPDIKNVLIVDPPRNMIDFLHRAGRTGRAGARGTVIIFGKSKGRGVTKDKEVRRKVNALLS